MNRNAYGTAGNAFQFSDTLTSAGTYRYNIYGIRVSDDIPLLLSQRRFTIDAKLTSTESTIVKVLPVHLQFNEHEKFQLRLYNYDGDHLLWKHKGESQGWLELFMVDPRPYVEYGVRKFQLLVLNGHGDKMQEIYFRVEMNGNVVKE
jgi:hypothetical protein